MPTAEEMGQGRRRGSGKRGSVNNAKRLAGLTGGTKTSGADWGNCDPRWLAGVVVQITAKGGACTFGCSRDGGAHSLTLLLDGERETLWFNGDADLDAELERVYTYLDSL